MNRWLSNEGIKYFVSALDELSDLKDMTLILYA